MTSAQQDQFYPSIPTFGRFSDVVEASNYRPLPDGWSIATADVVNSTGAIAEGRYKAVNMVGASVISALLNALKGLQLPFVFGGDGAAVAVPPGTEPAVRDALARVQVFAREEIGLTLRCALVPVEVIRGAGHDVTVARFQASPHAAYAMFAGGGIAWAERVMKQGLFAVPPAEAGARPDLEGLSCRWQPMPARNGVIASLLVVPREGVEPGRFAAVVHRVLDLVAEASREGHPVPPEGPGYKWPPPGLELEARASHGATPLAARRRKLWWMTLIALIFFRTGLRMGGFDPMHYRRTTAQNSDFRKFDDGLKLTIDCSEAAAAGIEAVLVEAAAAGVLDYGLHRQGEALMTCIVPSIVTDDHMHFIDGAAGGYAKAAEGLKKRVAERRAQTA
jgi:hypothetical protein